MPKSEKISFAEKIKNAWTNFRAHKKEIKEQKEYAKREKITVFIVAFLLALCLWFLINLSRSFNLTVNVPIEIGSVSTDKALTERLPEFASVSVEGEGWSLINFYNNPPILQINITGGQVNLIDQVREQMNTVPGVTVRKVQPAILSINLDDRISRKKKVELRADIAFKKQFGLLDSLTISPDSVTVSGANSIIESINRVQTEQIELEEVDSDINLLVDLILPHELIELNRRQVRVEGTVVEYTEGEIRALVRVNGAPDGLEVNFSPSVITIRYDVPIQEYSEAQDIVPFTAEVPFERLRQDSTGFVKPDIVSNAGDLRLKLRSYQPQQVEYFKVINVQ